jgi:hypothetical protein
MFPFRSELAMTFTDATLQSIMARATAPSGRSGAGGWNRGRTILILRLGASIFGAKAL